VIDSIVILFAAELSIEIKYASINLPLSGKHIEFLIVLYLSIRIGNDLLISDASVLQSAMLNANDLI
jgi:hypothetical protein